MQDTTRKVADKRHTATVRRLSTESYHSTGSVLGDAYKSLWALDVDRDAKWLQVIDIGHIVGLSDPLDSFTTFTVEKVIKELFAREKSEETVRSYLASFEQFVGWALCHGFNDEADPNLWFYTSLTQP